MADQKKSQTFTKVQDLRPQADGLNLTVKVISAKTVMPKARADGTQARQMRLAECLVGDETGIIIFTARNDQVDLMKEGNTVTISNARVEMFKGSMRLGMDRSGRVEVTAEPADFAVKENNNLSLIEFERIEVVAFP